IRTLTILVLCIIVPLLIFDGQILLNYGVFRTYHMCDDILSYETKQFQRALYHPLHESHILKNVSILYYARFFPAQVSKPVKCMVCILWNIIDTLIYAIIPFLIILTSSIIIITAIYRRRRSMLSVGGICHTNRRRISTRDSLSILLIAINCLFLIMTGPLNIRLIVQSVLNYFTSKLSSMKRFTQLNEYLRLLQNSYHALSFIFYCFVGNKFRSTACSTCQLVYCKLLHLSSEQRQAQSLVIRGCCGRNNVDMNRLPTLTSIIDDSKRISNLSNKITSSKRQSYQSEISIQNQPKLMDTPV
ncbi:unnamed protein product, partial [Rotaria magnacalcarata]